MTDLILADGEEIVKQYGCTAVDGCLVFAGTAIPLRSRRRESHGTITVTNRRVVYDLESSGRMESSIHQETRLESVASVSSISAKFGRDLRIPALMVVLGFILIFAPFVYAFETGAVQDSGDYIRGYNDGVEAGYYEVYLDAIMGGEVDNTIPAGYVVPYERFPSSEYSRGMSDGVPAGEERALADVAADRSFSIPRDLMRGDVVVTAVLVLAAVGAVVFIMGSVVFAISGRTKDWVRVTVGSGRGGSIYITSMSSGSDAVGLRPVVASEGFREMAEEIGAIILEHRQCPKEAAT